MFSVKVNTITKRGVVLGHKTKLCCNIHNEVIIRLFYRIEEHHSFTRNEKYYANTCPRCNTFVGQYYLFDYSEDIRHGDCVYKAIDLPE